MDMKKENTMVENELPDGWRTTTLGEVVCIIGGGTPKTTVDEFWNGNIPWLSVVDFNNDNRWVSKTEKTITEDGLNNSSTKLLDIGDLIISARGTVGALAQLKRPMAFNQSCYGLREIEDVSDEDFLFYLVRYSLQDINRNVHGAVFDTITRQTFDYISVNLPQLKEQKAIAKVLSSFDDKIELLQVQNKTLEETAQAIFKEWFGKYQVGDKLPEGWTVGTFDQVSLIYDSLRKPLSSKDRKIRNGKYRYYGATSVMDYIDDYIFDGTYLLFAEDGSVIDKNGNPFLQYVWGQFWVNNHAHVIKGKNGWTTELLYTFAKGMKVSGIINGAVQLKINQRNLLGYQMILPSVDVLASVNELISPLYNKLKINCSQIKQLQNTRDQLLPKLMSGELRVKL